MSISFWFHVPYRALLVLVLFVAFSYPGNEKKSDSTRRLGMNKVPSVL